MKKQVNIVATVGPSSMSEESIRGLIDNGVTIFRFNLKHNTHDWHFDLYTKIQEIASDYKHDIYTLADLKGPEMRAGAVSGDSVSLSYDKQITFSTKLPDKSEDTIQLDEKYISELSVGNSIVIGDRAYTFEIVEKSPTTLRTLCKSHSGEVGNSKTIFLPDIKLDIPSLTDKDIDDIELASRMDADYIALSFVRDREDLINFKKEVFKYPNFNPKIVTKFETKQAVENMDDIIEYSDVIMVARGDLAIEIGIHKVPIVQKQLITKTKKADKEVIVATQMILSMVENATPTRAEISDIANAVIDGTDFVMMSEETTIGKYPVEASGYMRRTIDHTLDNMNK